MTATGVRSSWAASARKASSRWATATAGRSARPARNQPTSAVSSHSPSVAAAISSAAVRAASSAIAVGSKPATAAITSRSPKTAVTPIRASSPRMVSS